MLCEQRGFFLEIADWIRSLGLTILKGVIETRADKIWPRFTVEVIYKVRSLFFEKNWRDSFNLKRLLIHQTWLEIWILGESRCDEDGNIHATCEYFGADNEMWR